MPAGSRRRSIGGPPPGRGKPAARWDSWPTRRWTPAWAGQTGQTPPPTMGYSVDPRLGRGKPSPPTPSNSLGGWTPAWAGQTDNWVKRRLDEGVDPRLGRANSCPSASMMSSRGGPPPGRGKRVMENRHCVSCRWTPAWAGQTRSRPGSRCRSGVDPRLGGANRERDHCDADGVVVVDPRLGGANPKCVIFPARHYRFFFCLFLLHSIGCSSTMPYP